MTESEEESLFTSCYLELQCYLILYSGFYLSACRAAQSDSISELKRDSSGQGFCVL